MYLLYYEHYEYEWDCWDSSFDPMQTMDMAITRARELHKAALKTKEFRNIKILDAQEVLNWSVTY